MYDINISYISIAVHVYFDEDMIDLPFEQTPNSLDLQQLEQYDSFLAKIEEVGAGKEFCFFLYPFAVMIERTLK